jgi:hypothetical protein
MSERKSSPHIAKIGFILACLCGLGLLSSVYGYRMEMWNHKMVFGVMTWATYGSIGAGILSIIGIVMARNARSGVSLAVVGVLISAAIVIVPYSYSKLLDRKLHPKIHDITTNTIDPPKFVAVIALRKEAKNKNPNSVKNKFKYAGEKVARIQKQFHPNLNTLIIKQPAQKVFKATLDLVKKQGWSVAAVIPTEGRIEATASTFWLGFEMMSYFALNKQGQKPASTCARPPVSAKEIAGKTPAGSKPFSLS